MSIVIDNLTAAELEDYLKLNNLICLTKYKNKQNDLLYSLLTCASGRYYSGCTQIGEVFCSKGRAKVTIW